MIIFKVENEAPQFVRIKGDYYAPIPEILAQKGFPEKNSNYIEDEAVKYAMVIARSKEWPVIEDVIFDNTLPGLSGYFIKDNAGIGFSDYLLNIMLFGKPSKEVLRKFFSLLKMDISKDRLQVLLRTPPWFAFINSIFTTIYYAGKDSGLHMSPFYLKSPSYLRRWGGGKLLYYWFMANNRYYLTDYLKTLFEKGVYDRGLDVYPIFNSLNGNNLLFVFPDNGGLKYGELWSPDGQKLKKKIYSLSNEKLGIKDIRPFSQLVSEGRIAMCTIVGFDLKKEVFIVKWFGGYYYLPFSEVKVHYEKVAEPEKIVEKFIGMDIGYLPYSDPTNKSHSILNVLYYLNKGYVPNLYYGKTLLLPGHMYISNPFVIEFFDKFFIQS